MLTCSVAKGWNLTGEHKSLMVYLENQDLPTTFVVKIWNHPPHMVQSSLESVQLSFLLLAELCEILFLLLTELCKIPFLLLTKLCKLVFQCLMVTMYQFLCTCATITSRLLQTSLIVASSTALPNLLELRSEFWVLFLV
jgi:hypothetical protein